MSTDSEKGLLAKAFAAGAEYGFMQADNGQEIDEVAMAVEFESWHRALTDLWPIEEVGLTIRAHNALKRAGVHTVGELRAAMDPNRFDGLFVTDIPNFGQKSYEDTKKDLARFDEEYRR